MNKDEYQEYLRSVHWLCFREEVLEDTEACEECGLTDTLNVHHRHYRSLGAEKRSDVVVLCERCHMNTHIIQDRAKMYGVPIHGRSLIERRNSVMREIDQNRGKVDVLKVISLARKL